MVLERSTSVGTWKVLEVSPVRNTAMTPQICRTLDFSRGERCLSCSSAGTLLQYRYAAVRAPAQVEMVTLIKNTVLGIRSPILLEISCEASGDPCHHDFDAFAGI